MSLPVAGEWNQMIFKVPANPDHSVMIFSSWGIITLHVHVPAAVVGSFISGTSLPSFYLGPSPQFCFAPTHSLFWLFCSSVTSRYQQPCCVPWGCPPHPPLSPPVDCATRPREGGLPQPQLTLSGFAALQAGPETAGGSLGCRDMGYS